MLENRPDHHGDLGLAVGSSRLDAPGSQVQDLVAGRVANKLSGLAFEEAENVEVGAVIKSADDKEVGRITSHTYSPHSFHIKFPNV